MSRTDDNKRVIERFLGFFTAGDVPGVMSLMRDDGDWWVAGTIGGLSGTYGKDALKKLLLGVKDVYRTGALAITPSNMVGEGDFVAVEADSYAELLDGRVYANRYHFLFELRGGLILHVKEYMDTRHASDTFSQPG